MAAAYSISPFQGLAREAIASLMLTVVTGLPSSLLVVYLDRILNLKKTYIAMHVITAPIVYPAHLGMKLPRPSFSATNKKLLVTMVMKIAGIRAMM